MEKHVLIGVTGSVAAIKVPEIVKQLTEQQDIKVKVEVVSTKAANHFFNPSSLPVKCHTDEEEWQWKDRGDPVLHIEPQHMCMQLRKWADLMVIAPLDANTMAKIATGVCDNLLTCVVRAWDLKRPLLYCPAMNTYMWEHPLTAEHLQKLSQFGYVQVPPVSKKLICGDQGVGAMAHVEDIVQTVLSEFIAQS